MKNDDRCQNDDNDDDEMVVMMMTLISRLEVELSVYCQDCHLQDFQHGPGVHLFLSFNDSD